MVEEYANIMSQQPKKEIARFAKQATAKSPLVRVRLNAAPLKVSPGGLSPSNGHFSSIGSLIPHSPMEEIAKLGRKQLLDLLATLHQVTDVVLARIRVLERNESLPPAPSKAQPRPLDPTVPKQ